MLWYVLSRRYALFTPSFVSLSSLLTICSLSLSLSLSLAVFLIAEVMDTPSSGTTVTLQTTPSGVQQTRQPTVYQGQLQYVQGPDHRHTNSIYANGAMWAHSKQTNIDVWWILSALVFFFFNNFIFFNFSSSLWFQFALFTQALLECVNLTFYFVFSSLTNSALIFLALQCSALIIFFLLNQIFCLS